MVNAKHLTGDRKLRSDTTAQTRALFNKRAIANSCSLLRKDGFLRHKITVLPLTDPPKEAL